MNRRAFLRFALPVVAGIALDRAVPLGRVWSFPSELRVRNLCKPEAIYDSQMLEAFRLQREEIAAMFRVPPHYLPTIDEMGVRFMIATIREVRDLRNLPELPDRLTLME